MTCYDGFPHMGVTDSVRLTSFVPDIINRDGRDGVIEERTAIAAIEGNVRACMAAWETYTDAEVEHDGPVIRLCTDVPLAMMNVATSTAPLGAELEARVAATSRFFAQRGKPCHWWDFPSGRSAALATCLQAEGFIDHGSAPGMALNLRDLNDDVRWPAHLSITPVADAAEMLQWAHTSYTGYELPDAYRQAYVASLAQYLRIPSMRFYLASFHQEPVVTAMVMLQPEVAGLYWIATVPAARGQGAGTAITLHALHEAREAGARLAVLEASPLGLPIYTRLGFREFCQVQSYVRNIA